MNSIPKKQRPLPVRQVHADNYVENKSGGTVNIVTNKVGRPISNNSMNAELKARIDEDDLKTIMAFCRGRKIDRSAYIRQLTSLDTDYFDYIEHLNDPDIKELFFHVLTVAKKI